MNVKLGSHVDITAKIVCLVCCYSVTYPRLRILVNSDVSSANSEIDDNWRTIAYDLDSFDADITVCCMSLCNTDIWI